MPDATSATATFLFTDIEGSTQLLSSHRREYANILADHHRLIRETFGVYGGKEIDNQGDSFFVAFTVRRTPFSRPPRAKGRSQPTRGPEEHLVKVRMGILTGEAELTVDRYVGFRFIARRGSALWGMEGRCSSRTRPRVSSRMTKRIYRGSRSGISVSTD